MANQDKKSIIFHKLISTLVITPGSTVVELGVGKMGYTKYYLTLVENTGQVIGFEPLKKFYDSAVEYSKSIAGNLKMFNYAVSKFNEIQVFFDCLQYPERGGLRATGGIIESYTENYTVSATTLDISLKNANIKKLSLLSMDIEGGEYDAIVGAKETIARYSPVIMSEVVPMFLLHFEYSVDDFNSLLKSIGYTQIVFDNIPLHAQQFYLPKVYVPIAQEKQWKYRFQNLSI